MVQKEIYMRWNGCRDMVRIGFLAAVISFGFGAQSFAADVQVKIGTLTILGNAPVFLADQQGFYRDEGLDARVSPDLTNVANAVPYVLGGNYDIATINTTNLMQALARKLPVQVIAPVWYDTPEFGGVYVAQDSGIKRFADLEGKNVGVFAIGNIQNIAIAKAVNDAGANSKNVQFIEAPPPNLSNLVKSGRLDAAGLQEPFVTIGGKGLRSIGSDIGVGLKNPNALVVIAITSKKYATEHPDIIRKFQRALGRAIDFANKNPDAVRKTMVDLTKMDPQVAGKMSLPMFKNVKTGALRDEMKQQSDAMVKNGFLKAQPDVNEAVISQSHGD